MYLIYLTNLFYRYNKKKEFTNVESYVSTYMFKLKKKKKWTP